MIWWARFHVDYTSPSPVVLIIRSIRMGATAAMVNLAGIIVFPTLTEFAVVGFPGLKTNYDILKRVFSPIE